MDVSQNWILQNWITPVSVTLLMFNLIAAFFTKNDRLMHGAMGLFALWGMMIGATLLARGGDLAIVRLLIDLVGIALFYRIAERDHVTGERHDWAALIVLAYLWLSILSARQVFFSEYLSRGFRISQNLTFFVTIAVNLLPSIFILLRKKPLLISVKPVSTGR